MEIKILKKIVLLLTISVFMLPNIVNADPYINPIVDRLSNGQSIIITGRDFGSKSTIAPVVWDNCTSTNMAVKWDGWWPNNSSNSTNNLNYRTPIRGVSLPHNHISKYMAGAHAGVSADTGANVMPWKTIQVTNYPTYIYFSAYVRWDPNWVFGLGNGDNNQKCFDFSNGNSPYSMNSLTDNNWYIEYNGRFSSSNGTGAWHLADDTFVYGTPVLNYPNDQNGHSWWWSAATNPFQGWIKQEFEIKLTNQNDGWVKVWENGTLKVNYAGRTSGWAGTTKTVAIGGFLRGSSDPLSVNNWRYFADLYFDTTSQRVVVCNGSTWATRGICEVQIPTTQWTNGQLQIQVNQGSFADNSTAFLYVVDANGAVSNGQQVFFGSGGSTDTTPPTATITAPSSNTTVSGTASVTATASDNSGTISRVDYYIETGGNSSLIGTSSTTPSYTISWNTALSANGTYNLYAKAYDAANNSGQSANIPITISNTTVPTTYTKTFGNATGSDFPNTVADTFLNIDLNVNSANAVLNTYTWPANKPSNSILMKWDISSIPTNAVVVSATLQLYQTTSGGDANYKIPVSAIINKSPMVTSATGYTYDGTNAWSANSIPYNSIPLAQSDITAPVDSPLVNTTNGYKSWNITDIVKGWLAGTLPNYGILLNSSVEATSDSYRTFASSEASTASQRPILSITYSIGAPEPVDDVILTIN